ncbi:hypothetical protein T439DRAFT_351799 [Meredithblackwellia eburnea MCA 4105]
MQAYDGRYTQGTLNGSYTYQTIPYSGPDHYPPPPSSAGTTPSRPVSIQSRPPSNYNDKASEAVKLAPWSRQWWPFVGLLVSTVLQSLLFAASLWVWWRPIARPISKFLFPLFTVKTFNLIVSFGGAIIGGAAAFGVAVGARSFLSQRLVGTGISLLAYDSLWAVGNSGIARRLSKHAIIPLIIYILLNTASSAVVAIWTAGNESVSKPVTMIYPSIYANPNHYNQRIATYNATELLHPEDFEGLVVEAANRVWKGDQVANVYNLVDGLNMTIGNGIAPSLHKVANYRQSLKVRGDQALPSNFVDIVTNSTTNLFTIAAPTAIANTTCTDLLNSNDQSTLFARVVRQNTTASLWAIDIFDSHCTGDLGGGIQTYINQGTRFIGGSIACRNNSQAYIAYYATNTQYANDSNGFIPLASCFTSVTAGDGNNIFYSDLNTSYTLPGSEAKDPFFLTTTNQTDVSLLAHVLVNGYWSIRTQTPTGSFGLQYLTSAISAKVNNSTGRYVWPIEETFTSLTRAMYSMAVAKLVNAETYYAVDSVYPKNGTFGGDQSVPNLSPYSAKITSDALVIGPQGYTSLLLIVVGVMLAFLVASVIIAILFPPVSLNPLDPVSVLLVAQNSPPSLSADGGCLGDVDQVRSKEDLIQYRAVNNQHLSFIFGPSFYEKPQFGRMYGTVTGRRKEKMD